MTEDHARQLVDLLAELINERIDEYDLRENGGCRIARSPEPAIRAEMIKLLVGKT